jgi:hypothetical protein
VLPHALLLTGAAPTRTGRPSQHPTAQHRRQQHEGADHHPGGCCADPKEMQGRAAGAVRWQAPGVNMPLVNMRTHLHTHTPSRHSPAANPARPSPALPR